MHPFNDAPLLMLQVQFTLGEVLVKLTSKGAQPTKTSAVNEGGTFELMEIVKVAGVAHCPEAGVNV